MERFAPLLIDRPSQGRYLEAATSKPALVRAGNAHKSAGSPRNDARDKGGNGG
jgi:hypothetical protein